MQYRELGKTGVFVSRLCLGTMTFGGPDTVFARALGRLAQDQATAIVKRALDAGINFIDTADVYGGGDSERQVGIALKGRRHEVVLATKGSARVGPGPNEVGQSRVHLLRALEESLKRLQTDYVDLYQVHNFDPRTPLEVVMRTFDDMVRAGKVRHVGCSNFAAWQLTKANGIAELKNLEPLVSAQSYYSLVGRDIERELIPAARDLGVGILCWSPLAGGFLAGKVAIDGKADPMSRRAHLSFPPLGNTSEAVVETLRNVAAQRGVSAARIALAWLLSRDHVTSIITGVKSLEQLTDNLEAQKINLSEDELVQLEDVSRLPPSYPGWIHTYNARGRVPTGHPFPGRSWSSGEEPA
jgi:aryl-alcohol dehydrogenase-like predicted oxidoreductase